MAKTEISFLILKDTYLLLKNKNRTANSHVKTEFFKKLLAAHIFSSFSAYCMLPSEIFERSFSAFNNSGIDLAVEEISELSKTAKVLFNLYTAYIKKKQEIKIDSIALTLLTCGVPLFELSEEVAAAVTESLVEQIHLLAIEDLSSFADYTCKVILDNLGNKKLNPYILADSTNPLLIKATLINGCVLSTFLPSKVKKIKLGKINTEGMLRRSGLKYFEKGMIVHWGKKGDKPGKYKEREMYSQVFAFFISIFNNMGYTALIAAPKSGEVHRSNLSRFEEEIVEIENVPLQHTQRVKVTDTGAKEDYKESAPKTANISFIIGMFAKLISYIKRLFMGTTQSKEKHLEKKTPTFFSSQTEAYSAEPYIIAPSPKKPEIKESDVFKQKAENPRQQMFMDAFIEGAKKKETLNEVMPRDTDMISLVAPTAEPEKKRRGFRK